MITGNRRSTFSKEVLTALLILTTCSMLSLHLLFDENSSTLYFLGYNFGHDYTNNQLYVWFTISYLQILAYTLLCFYFSDRRYKYALLALIYWMIYGLIWDIFPGSKHSFKLMIQCCSIFLTLSIICIIVVRKIRRQGDYEYVFKFKKYRSDGLIAFLLMLLPFLDRWSETLPGELYEVEILGTTISSKGFPNITSFVGYLLLKLYLILPVILLFFGVRTWWRYALLVPILLTVFQIRTALNPNSEFLDTFEILDAAPLLILVLTLLLFLSNTAYYQSKMKELYRKTYNHLEGTIQKKFKGREYFLSQTKAKWRKMKNAEDVNENELHKLKQHLEQELQRHRS